MSAIVQSTKIYAVLLYNIEVTQQKKDIFCYMMFMLLLLLIYLFLLVLWKLSTLLDTNPGDIFNTHVPILKYIFKIVLNQQPKRIVFITYTMNDKVIMT